MPAWDDLQPVASVQRLSVTISPKEALEKAAPAWGDLQPVAPQKEPTFQPVKDFTDYTKQNFEAGKEAVTAPPFKKDTTAGGETLQRIGDVGSRILGAAEMATAPLGGVSHAAISKPLERAKGVPAEWTDLALAFSPAAAGGAAGAVGRVARKLLPSLADEKIAEAAIRTGSGKIYTGADHDTIKKTLPAGKSLGKKAQEGFVTSKGQFVDRQQAAAIAQKAKQVQGTIGAQGLHAQNLKPPSKVQQLSKDVQKIFSPTTVSKEAGKAEGIVREQRGLAEQRAEQLKARLEPDTEYLSRLPGQQQLDFIKRVETYGKGAPLADARMEKAATNLRDIYRTVRNDLETDPNFDRMGFVQDYFPHMWSDPKRAQQFVDNWVSKYGSARSTQARKLPTLEDGIKAGLVPRSTNPAETTLQYIGNMYNYKALKGMQSTMSDEGLRKFFPAGKQPPGWVELKGPGNRNLVTTKKGPLEQKAYAPEDAARVYNRYYSPGWTGAAGNVARTLRSIVNGGTQMVLGLSGYHYRLIANEATAAALSKGLSRVEAGKPREALRAVAGATPYAGAYRMYKQGKNVEQQYITGKGALDQKIIDYMTRAGGRMKGLDKTMRTSQGTGDYWQAWKNGTLKAALKADTMDLKAGGPIKAIGKVMDTVAKPLFVKTIPRIKNAVNYEAIADWVKFHPQASDEQILKASRDIIDSTDNRFGEMIQDNLFWDKKLKESVQLMLLSTGWALGTGREIVGGTKDLAKALSEGTELTPRARYIIAAPISHMLHASVYQYLKTGTLPSQPQDLMYPKTGGVSLYGDAPEREAVPSQVKDIIGYEKHPGSELYNKLAPVWKTVMEMATNKDWRGDPIYLRDIANAPGPVKAYAEYLLGAYSPISIKGVLEKPLKGSTIGRAESLLGSRPAGMEKENPEAYDNFMRAKRLKEEKAALRHRQMDEKRRE